MGSSERPARHATHYPAGTGAQFVALCEAKLKSRKFERNGWDLAMRGYVVAEVYYLAPLKDNANLIDRLRTELLEPAEEDDDRYQKNEALYKKIANQRASGPLLGGAKLRMKAGKFAILISRLMEIPLGRIDLHVSANEDNETPDTRTLLKGLFGFLAPGQELPEEAVKYLIMPVEALFAETADQFSLESVCDRLDRMILSGELDVARDQWHQMSNGFSAALKQKVPRTQGEAALLEAASAQSEPPSVDHAARLFLLWLFIRETPSMRKLTQDFLPIFPQFADRNWQIQKTTVAS